MTSLDFLIRDEVKMCDVDRVIETREKQRHWNEGAAIEPPDICYYIEQRIGVLEREIKMLQELKLTVSLFPKSIQQTISPFLFKGFQRD